MLSILKDTSILEDMRVKSEDFAAQIASEDTVATNSVNSEEPLLSTSIPDGAIGHTVRQEEPGKRGFKNALKGVLGFTAKEQAKQDAQRLSAEEMFRQITREVACRRKRAEHDQKFTRRLGYGDGHTCQDWASEIALLVEERKLAPNAAHVLIRSSFREVTSGCYIKYVAEVFEGEDDTKRSLYTFAEAGNSHLDALTELYRALDLKRDRYRRFRGAD